MCTRIRLINFRSIAVAVFLITAITVSAQAGTNQRALNLKQETFSSLISIAFQSDISFSTHENFTLNHQKALMAFYESRSNKPLWLSKKQNIADLVSLLEESWTHGLNSSSYHLTKISELLASVKLSDNHKALLELLLTEAAIEYGRDLTGMRLDHAAIGEDPASWREPLSAEEILQAISADGNPVRALNSLMPQGQFYNLLRQELVSLASLPKTSSKSKLNFDVSYFYPGDRHRHVPLLRMKLHGYGLQETGNNPEIYDDSLAASVMEFQRRRNLKPDGIIGPNTLSALNHTREAMIKQVIANLERLRWLDQSYPERYLLVNVPSQKLWAVENGRTVHEMKVVVGKPSRPTMRFVANVSGIRFNPSWNVPVSIKFKDFLPDLQKDPYALSDKGIEFIRGYGDQAVSLDPGSINWHAVGYSEMHQIRMVQTPGNHNALGRIRILMPNQYNIYLHDTNHRSLFENETRTFSSGCVRMEEPEKIANFILAKNHDWHGGRINEYLQLTHTVEVAAEERLPVYIVYQTMWLDEQGQLVYGLDVYNKDRSLIEALAANGELPAFGKAAKEVPSLASINTIQ